MSEAAALTANEFAVVVAVLRGKGAGLGAGRCLLSENWPHHSPRRCEALRKIVDQELVAA